MQTDASVVAVGGILFQIYTDPEGKEHKQLLGIFSKKLSPSAARWCTIRQETYALVATIHHFEDMIHGKEIQVECDHNNIAADKLSLSTIPIICRWRAYLQNFRILIRHTPGRLNIFADFLSRCYGDERPPIPGMPEDTSNIFQISFLSIS